MIPDFGWNQAIEWRFLLISYHLLDSRDYLSFNWSAFLIASSNWRSS